MRILVATDLTARSDRAVARGFMMARELNAKLHVLHVVAADLPEDLLAHSIDWARRALADEEARQSRIGGKVTASFEVVAGDAGTDIVRAADPQNTDLLVLGVHPGSGDSGKAFSATTAGRILQSSLTAALW